MKAVRWQWALLLCICALGIGCASGVSSNSQSSQSNGQSENAVSNPQAVASSSANITWTTNQPASSEVEYGTTTAYANTSPLDPTLTMSHSVTLTGLTKSTLYHYRVISVNAHGGQTTSGDLTFATK